MLEPFAPAPAAEILIVDDTPVSLSLVCDILSGAGYQVRTASSGEFALQAVALLRPPWYCSI